MNTVKRIPAAWSFAAGALVGCGAVLLSISLVGSASPAVAGPQLRHHAPVRAEAPAAPVTVEAPASASVTATRPAAKRTAAKRTAAAKDHWELELLLD